MKGSNCQGTWAGRRYRAIQAVGIGQKTVLFSNIFDYFSYLDLRLRLYKREKRIHYDAKKGQLLEASAAFEQTLQKLRFEQVMKELHLLNLSDDEKVFIANKHFQPYLDEVSKEYPNIGLGVFYKEMSRIIAIGPNASPDALLQRTFPDTTWKIYQSKKPLLQYIENSIGWAGKPVLNMQSPIYHNGEIIGHTWASQRVEEIDKEIASTVNSIGIIIFSAWVLMIYAIGYAFNRLIYTSEALASQIRHSATIPAYLKDFPELLPIVDTISELREMLKNEYIKKIRVYEKHKTALEIQADLLKTAKSAIFVLDKDWRFSYLNLEAEQMWGYSRQELIGQKIWNKFPEAKKSTIYEKYHEAVTNKTQLTFEAFSLIKHRWFEFRIQPTSSGLVVSCNDINEKKQLTLKLQHEANTLKQLIEICPIGITVVDNDAKVIACNQQGRLLANYDLLEDMTGKPWKQVAAHLQYDFEETSTAKALRGERVINRPMYIGGRDLIVNSVPLTNGGDTPTGAVTVMQDVTDYKKMDKEMQRLDRLSLISQMASGLAHEIRNPLTVIKGYLQFLRKKTPEEMNEQFDLVLTELVHVEKIITDFLTLATNKNTSKTEKNINEIIEEVYPLLFAHAVQRGIEIELNLQEIPALPVDEKEIKQLILNLCLNSIEAITDSGGKILIETIKTADYVQLRVKDNGSGIPSEHVDKIFDPFYTTKTSGTGLGLSVCSSIVHRHCGAMELESAVGHGTQFIVKIPTSAPN